MTIQQQTNKSSKIDTNAVVNAFKVQVANPLNEKLNKLTLKCIDGSLPLAPSELVLNTVKRRIKSIDVSSDVIYQGICLNKLSYFLTEVLKEGTQLFYIVYGVEEGYLFANNPFDNKESTVGYSIDLIPIKLDINAGGDTTIKDVDEIIKTLKTAYDKHLNSKTHPIHCSTYYFNKKKARDREIKFIFNPNKPNTVFERFPKFLSVLDLFTDAPSNGNDYFIADTASMILLSSRYNTDGNRFLISLVDVKGVPYFHLCDYHGKFERLFEYHEFQGRYNFPGLTQLRIKRLESLLDLFCHHQMGYKRQPLSVFLNRFVKFADMHHNVFVLTPDDAQSVKVKVSVISNEELNDVEFEKGYYLVYKREDEQRYRLVELLLNEEEIKQYETGSVGDLTDSFGQLSERIYRALLKVKSDVTALIKGKSEEGRKQIYDGVKNIIIELTGKHQKQWSDNGMVVEYLNKIRFGKHGIILGTNNPPAPMDSVEGSRLSMLFVGGYNTRNDAGAWSSPDVSLSISSRALFKIGNEFLQEGYGKDTLIYRAIDTWLDIICRLISVKRNIRSDLFNNSCIALSQPHLSELKSDDKTNPKLTVSSDIIISMRAHRLFFDEMVEEFIEQYQKDQVMPFDIFYRVSIEDSSKPWPSNSDYCFPIAKEVFTRNRDLEEAATTLINDVHRVVEETNPSEVDVINAVLQHLNRYNNVSK